METGASSAGSKVAYFHIRTARASAMTESFIGDYCWRMMESDNTRTETGGKKTFLLTFD